MNVQWKNSDQSLATVSVDVNSVLFGLLFSDFFAKFYHAKFMLCVYRIDRRYQSIYNFKRKPFSSTIGVTASKPNKSNCSLKFHWLWRNFSILTNAASAEIRSPRSCLSEVVVTLINVAFHKLFESFKVNDFIQCLFKKFCMSINAGVETLKQNNLWWFTFLAMCIL